MICRLTILVVVLVILPAEMLAQGSGFSQTEAVTLPQTITAAPLVAPNNLSQVSSSPFRGSVATGAATAQEMSLSLQDAVNRGLKYNLGLLLSRQRSRASRANRGRSWSALLPNVSARTAEWAQQNNLQAFGFSGFADTPTIVGPFSVFDSRAYLSQPLVDISSWRRAKAASVESQAAESAYHDAREQVVWVVANLYFRASAGASRVNAARSQLQTAEAVYRQASDFKEAGVVPAIEVLRAQVEMEAQQQRLIYYENEEEKQRLELARAIGLPLGQRFHLTEELAEAILHPIELPEALHRAFASRADYQKALQQLRAAELRKKAASAERLPDLIFNGEYGAIGRTPGNSHGTFAATASVQIPLFQGGKIRADVLQADTLVAERKSELEDLRGRIEYETRVAFLDMQAAQQRVEVARSAKDLAAQQLVQAQDRFAAGVAGNLEVVQAQEAVSTAQENYITGLYTYNLAKATLARTLGVAETSLRQFLRGEMK